MKQYFISRASDLLRSVGDDKIEPLSNLFFQSGALIDIILLEDIYPKELLFHRILVLSIENGSVTQTDIFQENDKTPCHEILLMLKVNKILLMP